MGRGVFIGRDRELAEIGRSIDAALAGSGAVVLIDGEPGIGKTSLADEVTRRVRREGWRTAWGGCLDGGAAPAYRPWVKALRDLGDPAEQLITPGSRGDAGGRFRLFDEVIGVLRRSAEPGLLLILDDLHWADVGSLRLLQVLAAEVGEQPMLVLGLSRGRELAEHEAAAVLTAIARERATLRICLGGLSDGELENLASATLDRPPEPVLMRAVRDRSEGNPFHALELLRHAEESGRLVPGLPDGVRAVIGRRLDSVPAATRELLRRASVLGRDFTVRQVVDLTGQQPGAVLELLDEALARDLVLLADHEFRFAHALTQEVAYAELTVADRQRLHARAAELTGDDDAVVDSLAHHLRQAAVLGSAEQAMEATLRAARRARRQLAFEHAAYQFRRAIELLPLLPEVTPSRPDLLLELARCEFRSGAVSDAWASSQEAAELGLAAGDACVMADAATVLRGISNSTVDPVCDQINGLCRQALALLGDDDPVREAKLLAQEAITTDAFSCDGRTTLSERALQLAEATGDVDARFLALQARQVQLVHPRHVLERLTNGEHAVRLGGETGNDDYAAWGRVWRLEAFWELGRRAQLEREVAEYAALAERMKEPLHLWRLTMVRACLAELHGQFDEAHSLADDARRIGIRGGHQGAEFVHLIFRARVARLTGRGADQALVDVRRFVENGPHQAYSWLAVQLAAMGRTEEAATVFRAGEPHQLEMPPHAPEWIPAQTGAACLCARFGGRGTAAALYEELLPYADRQVGGGHAGSEGPVSRSLGMLALRLDDFDAAEAHLAAAVDSCLAMGSPPYEALSRLEIARLMLARGGPGDLRSAEEQLETASELAGRLGMEPVESEIARLRAEHPKGSTTPLSRREAEVAGLVAEGLSNRQIAERLFLSERTVESHVRNIFTKLDFERRTQIASWMSHRSRA